MSAVPNCEIAFWRDSLTDQDVLAGNVGTELNETLPHEEVPRNGCVVERRFASLDAQGSYGECGVEKQDVCENRHGR